MIVSWKVEDNHATVHEHKEAKKKGVIKEGGI